MRPESVIFDFNGTLFFDSHKHIEAWKRYIRAHGFGEISDETFKERFLGRNNAEILPALYGRPLSDDEIEREAEAKEAIYRDVCREKPEELHLVKGAEALFDCLQAREIPFTLATGSNLANVRFYFDTFGLGRWFDLARVVYDDGTLPGKPDPAIYHKALAALGVSPEGCTVFEDSFSGIHAAKNAGVSRVVAIATPEGRAYVEKLGLADLICTDFCDLAAFGLG